MRALIITSWLLLAAPVCTFASGTVDTNELTLFTTRSQGQVDEWRISESRLRTTPEWNPDESIPLPPDKAWQVARGWSLAHGYSEPHLAGIMIQPFNTPGTSQDIRRYYYNINCTSPEKRTMGRVVVLMDGTVLEPHHLAEAPADTFAPHPLQY